MKYLFDSHIAYWTVSDPQKLSANASKEIKDPGNELFVSDATLFEFAIKMAIGKFSYKGGIQSFISDIKATGIRILRTEENHYVAYTALPLRHRDPFDRMIITQAKVEGLTIYQQRRRIQEV
jgi:PIN domain nuclease of toxin-antitoxin system